MKEYRAATLEMMLCAAMWSIGGLLIKLVPWNAFAIAGVRSVVAAAVVGAYLLIRRVPLRFSRRTLLIAVALSGTYLSFVSANKLTSAANAIVLQYCAPVFILLYGAFVKKQRMRLFDCLAVLGTFAGILLFFLDDLGMGGALGNVVAVVSGMFFAAMFLSADGVDADCRMNGILQGQLLTALIGVPFAFFFETPVTTGVVLGITALGVFQLGLPYILYALAVRRCPPLTCAVLAALEPLLNPVWVFLVTGEAPGRLALPGGLLVILSVTLWCVFDGKRAEKGAPAAQNPA